MKKCEVCGNEYDNACELIQFGKSHDGRPTAETCNIRSESSDRNPL